MFNPIPNDKIWDVSKFKAFAYGKLKIDRMTISLFDKVENTVGKGENADFFHSDLKKFSFLGSLRVGTVW